MSNNMFISYRRKRCKLANSCPMARKRHLKERGILIFSADKCPVGVLCLSALAGMSFCIVFIAYSLQGTHS